MKKALLILASFCTATLFASCMFIAGEPQAGEVRVALTTEDPVYDYSQYYGYSMSMSTYAGYLSFSEFPSTITWDDFIEHDAGTFTAKYLLFGWDGQYSYYWSDLADDWMYYPGDVTEETADYRSQRATTITYTIVADEGTSATLLTMPEDGEDRDYTILLTYDPADLSVSYRGIDIPLLSRSVDDASVRKVFGDGYYTIDVRVERAGYSDASAKAFRLDE